MARPAGTADFSDPRLFKREDEKADRVFYEQPRLLLHVDEQTSRALAGWLQTTLPPRGDILDLMSAYASHLPPGPHFRTVVGLGMNTIELRENPALTSGLIADLNARPVLPFRDRAFDVCLLSFSIQYLTKPVPVFAEIARVLKPGGTLHVAFSRRLFPTKAVAVWRAGSDQEHARLVALYVLAAGGFALPDFNCPLDGKSGFDPLYVVSASKA